MGGDVMPPPRLPKDAAALAGIVGTTVIGITDRQGTGVSTSDCIRGVHAAMKAGLSVVGYDFPKLVADAAHNADGAAQVGHTGGFCRACSGVYVAVNVALQELEKTEED